MLIKNTGEYSIIYIDMLRKLTRLHFTFALCTLLTMAPALATKKYSERTYSGKYNNRKKKNWGKAGCPLARFAQNQYDNKKGDISTDGKANPRAISNLIFNQEAEILSKNGLSDMVWQWGQFLDHDLDLSNINKAEPMPIEVPEGDQEFETDENGNQIIAFFRSLSRIGKKSRTRTQINEISSYIDASNVYGSDPQRAQILRQLNSGGQMKQSSNGRLPLNNFGMPNAGGATRTDLYLAGDVRANEQIGLVAMHTLFVREHNRKAAIIAAQNPNLTDEEIYQKTREYIGALMQQITYNEFLPALLGAGALKPYAGYKKNKSATISNEFATVAYRFGHSAVSPEILKVDNEGNVVETLEIMTSFFKPDLMASYEDMGLILKGLGEKSMQEVDTKVMSGLRNFLFKDVPGEHQLDLVAVNIQRGRDHGIANFNKLRAKFGLTPYTSFNQITSDSELSAKLASLYSSVEDADPWVLALAEDHKAGSNLGETAHAILVDQFERLRDGDRFWFERTMTAEEIAEIKSLKLSDIVKLNSQITNIKSDIFRI